MASVQELILAAKARQPRNAIAELAQSYSTGMEQGLIEKQRRTEIATRLLENQRIQDELDYQNELKSKYQEQQRQREQALRQDLNSTGSPKPSAFPADKLQSEIVLGKKGYEIKEPKESSLIYTHEQVDAISSGDPQRLIKAFPLGVPKEAMTHTSTIANRQVERSNKLAEQDESRIQNIRKEITGSKSYQGWLDIKNASDNLQDAATNPTAKRSLGALYSYVKALDPGSVVREGEIALAGEARSTATKLEGFFRKIANGQVLTPDEIKELAEWAKVKEGIAKDTALRSNKPAVEQAKRNKYDLKEVNSDLFGEQEESGKETPAQRKARLIKEYREAK